MEKQASRFYPLWFLVRIILGIIFIYSGLGKLSTPLAETRALFYEYALLPAFAVPWIALLFPWVEFFTGAFLVFGYMTRLSALAVMGFTFSFINLLGSEMILKGHFPLDCGCFAGSWKLPPPAIFVMDVINFFLTLQLVRIKEHRWSLDQWIQSEHGWIKPRVFRFVVAGIFLSGSLSVLAVGLRNYVAVTDSFGLSKGFFRGSVSSPAQTVVNAGSVGEVAVQAKPKGVAVGVPTATPVVSVSTMPLLAQGRLLKQMGGPDAPVEIVEYTDFQCPACRGAKPVIAELMAKHPGQIRLVFKHYPLSSHIWAKPAHRAAECAHEQGHFWLYYDLLYENQQEWAIEQPSAIFMKYAESLRLDIPRFQGCVNSSAPDIAVEADIAEAKQRMIRATPTFFINGERVVGSYELKLKGEEIIEKILKGNVKQGT